MSNKVKKPLGYWLLWTLALFVGFFMSGCSKAEQQEASSKSMAVTARFTKVVDIEPQNSDKCIACHTKTHPITKLASEPTDSGHGGEGG
ncbi:MAG: hypothetical protein WCR91_02415 [Sphaerochaetaceae bacterium]|jgi:hypothetical protein